MSIGLTLIHTPKIEKLIHPRNVLDLEETNLVEYFIDNNIGVELKKGYKVFHSEDVEFKKTTNTDSYGCILRYIKISDLDDIPKDIIKGKREVRVRKAIDYFKQLDGYIILWFT
jgi:hypothetical protein